MSSVLREDYHRPTAVGFGAELQERLREDVRLELDELKGLCRNYLDAVAAVALAAQGTLAADRASSSVTGPNGRHRAITDAIARRFRIDNRWPDDFRSDLDEG